MRSVQYVSCENCEETGVHYTSRGKEPCRSCAGHGRLPEGIYMRFDEEANRYIVVPEHAQVRATVVMQLASYMWIDRVKKYYVDLKYVQSDLTGQMLWSERELRLKLSSPAFG